MGKRKYFIDYFQIWIPNQGDVVYERDFEEKIKLNVNTNLFNEKIKNRIIKAPILSLRSFFFVNFKFGGLTLHLKGVFFDDDNYINNVSQIFNAIKIIFDAHKTEFDFSNIRISRIDFACNLPFFLNTNPFKIKKSDDKLKQYNWYMGEQKSNNLNGLQIGKRGADGLQLSIYDKRYSPNKNTDHRFKTINYTRLEYKIGRKYLTGKYGKLQFGTLKKLREYQNKFPNEVLTYCESRSNLIFDGEFSFKNRYELSDYNNAEGKEIDNNLAESKRVEIKEN